MARNPNQTLLIELDGSTAQEKLNSLTQKRIIELELQFSGDVDSKTKKLEKQLGKISRQIDSIQSGLAEVGKESESTSGDLLQTASAVGSVVSGLAGGVSIFNELKKAQPSFG